MKPLLVLCLAAGAALAQPRSQTVEPIQRALNLAEGSRIADLGAGQGDYTFPLAKIVGPTGKVYAVDIDEKRALPALRNRAARDRHENVEVVAGSPDDPHLPAGELDAVIIVNAYHEMDTHESILRHVHDALKPEGRLLIIDNLAGDLREESRAAQTKRHRIEPALVESDLRAAGFKIVLRDDRFDVQVGSPRGRWMMIAIPEAPTAR